MKTAQWLAWNAVYLFRNRWRRESLHDFMRRCRRCSLPWRKFKPCIYHNDTGKRWHVWFSNEVAVTERRTVTVSCHIGEDSGHIVGFTIKDCELMCPCIGNVSEMIQELRDAGLDAWDDIEDPESYLGKTETGSGATDGTAHAEQTPELFGGRGDAEVTPSDAE